MKPKWHVSGFTTLLFRECLITTWHEAVGGLSSYVFASYLENYIERSVSNHEEIVIYSDCCTYQSRNTILSNMLVNLVVKLGIVIIHKYLEPNHTHMECDSVHSMMEHQLRRKSINSAAMFVDEITKARKKQLYDVAYLLHKFFTEYLNMQYYSNIRPGCKKGDPLFTDLRQLRHNADATIEYKLRRTSQWQLLPRSSKIQHPTAAKKPLYSQAPKYNVSSIIICSSSSQPSKLIIITFMISCNMIEIIRCTNCSKIIAICLNLRLGI